MKAYVFDGKDSAKLEERPIPTIEKQSDVIVRIEKPQFVVRIYIY